MLLIGNGTLITRDPQNPFVQDGAVVIDGERIVDVGDSERLRRDWPQAEFMDARGRLVMPGLINAHQHFYSTFARGMPNDSPAPTKFSEILTGLWWRLDKALDLEDVYYSAAIPLIEGIRNGVTTVFDHHASPFAVQGSLAMIQQAGRDLGVRVSTCYEVSDRDGADSTAAGIAENMAAIQASKEDDSDLFNAMFGLHASMTVSDQTMDRCLQAMAGENAGFHVHVSEGIEDVEDALSRYGKRPIKRWHDFGILDENSIAVHCIHLDEEELDILAETGVKVVHNPESNMGNAVGRTPLIRMKERGVAAGLGTDGFTFDMFESWKVGNLIHKHGLGDPNVAWGELPDMLFYENAAIANKHFRGETGMLKKGKYADVIVLDYKPATTLDAGNADSHLLFGAMGRMVDTTIVNGRVLMKERVLQGIDEEQMFARARERSKKVWERF